ncbi:MAG: two-component system cell cycle response regulator [Lentimonas sp.]|jgi:two-component system cell cycle response regulator
MEQAFDEGNTMSGRILIIDAVATNRIVMKVKLLSAQYDVVACATQADGLLTFSDHRPDLILINLSDQVEDHHAFCRALKDDHLTSDIAIVGTGISDTSRARFAALDAGADDILTRPINDTFLLARIRSLLRKRHTPAELWLREGAQRALGFEETATLFEAPPRVTLLTANSTMSTGLIARLNRINPLGVVPHAFDEALKDISNTDAPDLFVIDSTTMQNPREDLFRMVAELRSRVKTKNTSQLVILPADAVETAAMALDLGADDVVTTQISSGEMKMRCDALARQKRQQDRLRTTVRDGLQAAVTDPLTGLYNRRYATPYLLEISKQSRRTGQKFAVMMIDIDHFKVINDKYGHAAGDAVLVELASRLRKNLRVIDLIARVGGEEFLVALPHSTAEQAQIAANRLCTLVNQKQFEIGHGFKPLRVTVSVGVAVGCANSTEMVCADNMCHQADGALYLAKSAGRDQVALAHSAA